LNFATGVDYLNQVITYDRIKYWGYLMDLLANGNGDDGKGRKVGPKPDIVFGRRIVDKPVLQKG
jgi:hypothetical protein